MLKFTFLTHSTSGKSDPALSINNQSSVVVKEGSNNLDIFAPDTGSLVLDFFNKTESDTITDSNGNIIKDTVFRFETVWCDDIKLESWFLTDAVYRPRYFDGFLQQVPNAPTEIASPYQFNFPGTISWQWNGNFWDWYFEEKTKREVINFLDRDPDRVWKFRGSLDPCQDLVVKIKELLKI